MEHNIYLYILVVAGVTYLIRVLPLTLIRREIKNTFLRSFLYYVPYVTLAAMTFPAILHATDSIWSGLAALVVGVIVAWFSGNLFLVAASGMAGLGSANAITTRRVSRRFYLCGDGVSDVADGLGLVASRVAVCAGHQAHMVLRLLAEEYEP